MATVELERYCTVCKLEYTLDLDTDKVIRWAAGEHVQNVWPELSRGDREQIISGTHDACWDDLFGTPESRGIKARQRTEPWGGGIGVR